MAKYEVIGTYAHGYRATVVEADTPEAAEAKARPELRSMLPSNYKFANFTVYLEDDGDDMPDYDDERSVRDGYYHDSNSGEDCLAAGYAG